MSKLLSIFTIYFVRYFSVHFSCIHVRPQLGNCANMGPAHLFKADSGGSFVISCSTQKHDEIPAVYARVSSNIKVVSFVGSKRSLAAVRPQEANSFVCIALQGTDVIPPNVSHRPLHLNETCVYFVAQFFRIQFSAVIEFQSGRSWHCMSWYPCVITFSSM